MSQRSIADIKRMVVEQADAMADGWFDMAVPEGFRSSGSLRVPRAPFELWAVSRSNGSHLVAPWNAVSPIGVKQGADDPYHTDWMLGAGLDPQDMRPTGGNPFHEALSTAAYKARAEVERRILGYQASILLQGPTVRGRVHVPTDSDDLPPMADEDGLPPVTIVRNANARWLGIAMRTFDAGGALVVESGGEMAHLVTVLRESNVGPIMLVRNARKLYPPEAVVEVRPWGGSIGLVEDSRLVAEAAATAINAPAWREEVVEAEVPVSYPLPEEGDPAPSVYGLVRDRKGAGSPTDSLEYFLPWGKHEYERFSIYVSLCRSSMHAERSTLQLVVHPNEPSSRGRKSVSFHSAHREWTSEEIGKACRELRDFLDPGYMARVVARAEERREARVREREEAKQKWSSMSDEKIVEFLEIIGEEELDLYHEYYTNEEIGFSEYSTQYEQYRTAFSIMREILGERGSDIDVDAYRPAEEERAEVRRKIEERQRRHDEYLEGALLRP